MGSQTLLFVSFIRWASALSQVSISGIWPLDTLFLVAAKHKQGVPFLQWDVYPPHQITLYYFLHSQQPNTPLELLRQWNMYEKKVLSEANAPPAAVAGQWLVTTWAGSARVWSHRSSLRAAAVRTAITNRLRCLHLTKELQMGADNFSSDKAGLTVTIKKVRAFCPSCDCLDVLAAVGLLVSVTTREVHKTVKKYMYNRTSKFDLTQAY